MQSLPTPAFGQAPWFTSTSVLPARQWLAQGITEGQLRSKRFVRLLHGVYTPAAITLVTLNESKINPDAYCLANTAKSWSQLPRQTWLIRFVFWMRSRP
ncbi:MAG: hypothetical protein FWG16_07335, partial [Micrococcales bacterium]|nr:hypothetical protein [Micrococcales bacterium]